MELGAIQSLAWKEQSVVYVCVKECVFVVERVREKSEAAALPLRLPVTSYFPHAWPGD